MGLINSNMIRNIFIFIVVISITKVKNEDSNDQSMEKARMNANIIICNDTEPKPKICINVGRVLESGRVDNNSKDWSQELGDLLEDFFSRSLSGSSLYGTLFWITFGIMIGLLVLDVIFLMDLFLRTYCKVNSKPEKQKTLFDV